MQDPDIGARAWTPAKAPGDSGRTLRGISWLWGEQCGPAREGWARVCLQSQMSMFYIYMHPGMWSCVIYMPVTISRLRAGTQMRRTYDPALQPLCEDISAPAHWGPPPFYRSGNRASESKLPQLTRNTVSLS